MQNSRDFINNLFHKKPAGRIGFFDAPWEDTVEKWVKEEGVPSQGWYAKQAFAFLAAGVVTLVVYFILKRSVPAEANLKPALTKMLGAAVTLIVIICMGYMLYYEFDKWGVFTSMGWQ